MEDYYTIQTPGHHSSMFAVLHTLQKQGVMCDVILAAENGEVMVHKVVLMAASKFFREKLSPVLSATALKITLKGISVLELANIVKYIYTGKLLVARDTMDITLQFSKLIELDGVIQGFKDIVSYKHLKGSTEIDLSVKNQQTSDQSAIGSSPAKKQHTDETSQGEGQTNLSSQNLSSGSVNTPTVMERFSSASMMLQPDLIQGVKATEMEHSEDASAETCHGETAEVSTFQYPSDYNFDTLLDQQNLGVSAGFRTPSRRCGINSPQAVNTLPKLQQMSALSKDSQKIAVERAQDQYLASDGMIANIIIPALSGEKGDSEESASISKETKVDGTIVKASHTSETSVGKPDITEGTPTEQNQKFRESYCSPDKTSKGYLDVEDKKSSVDIQLLHAAGTDGSLKDGCKRKKEKSENCSVLKTRKITCEIISNPSYSEKHDAPSNKQFQPSALGSDTIQVERARKGITESPETRGKARGNKKENIRSEKVEEVEQTSECVTGTGEMKE